MTWRVLKRLNIELHATQQFHLWGLTRRQENHKLERIPAPAGPGLRHMQRVRPDPPRHRRRALGEENAIGLSQREREQNLAAHGHVDELPRAKLRDASERRNTT